MHILVIHSVLDTNFICLKLVILASNLKDKQVVLYTARVRFGSHIHLYIVIPILQVMIIHINLAALSQVYCTYEDSIFSGIVTQLDQMVHVGTG